VQRPPRSKNFYSFDDMLMDFNKHIFRDLDRYGSKLNNISMNIVMDLENGDIFGVIKKKL